MWQVVGWRWVGNNEQIKNRKSRKTFFLLSHPKLLLCCWFYLTRNANAKLLSVMLLNGNYVCGNFGRILLVFRIIYISISEKTRINCKVGCRKITKRRRQKIKRRKKSKKTMKFISYVNFIILQTLNIHNIPLSTRGIIEQFLTRRCL